MRFYPLLFLILLIFTANSVLAQELKPLPALSPDFQLSAYAETTDTIKKTFSDVNDFGFEVSLPKSWVERSALGQTFGELIRYEGPAFGDVRPYFSLKRVQMNRENSARLEIIAYMLKSGYVLRSLNEIDDRHVEALYVVTEAAGDSFAVRAQVAVSGPSMILAEYALPISAWEQMANEQTFAVQSFKFLNLSEAPIEKRVERTYFHSLRFFYPASWTFESEQAAHDNLVRVTLTNPGEVNNELGRMSLSVVGFKSLKDAKDKRVFKVDISGILKETRKRYEDLGYELSEQSISSRKPDLNLETGFAVLDVYELRQRLTEYEKDTKAPVTKELWLAVFQTKPAENEPAKTYIAELLAPARGQDIYLWSINSRAFEIMLKSVQ